MSQSVSVRLDEQILEQLDLMARASDRSRAWLMAQAIRRYVEQEAWEIEAIEKALKKLKAGRATFADHEAVEGWVMSWDMDDEKDRPGCG